MAAAAVVVPVLGVAVGCSGSDDDDSSNNSSSSGGMAADAALTQWYAALCDLEDRCAGTGGRRWSTKDVCNANVYADMDTYYRATEGMSLADHTDAHFNVNAGQLQACLDHLRTVACTDVDNAPSCSKGFVPKHAVTAGQACDTWNDACTGTTACQADSGRCGVCTTLQADGTACMNDSECEHGNCASRTCAPAPTRHGKNEACATSDECLGNLECRGVTGNKKCLDRGGNGAGCGGSQPDCYEDLACIYGTCAAMPAEGSACMLDAFNEHLCANFCIFSTPTATTGTCQGTATLPTAGQACAYLNMSGNFSPLCATTAYPDSYDGQPCTCQAKLADGATCGTAYPNSRWCTSGYCDPTTKKCAPLACE